MPLEWTYARPTSTFADTLLSDGARCGGEVIRYSRVEPKGPVPAGQAVRVLGAYYAGFVNGERMIGEHDTLAQAQAAVEVAVLNQSSGHQELTGNNGN